MVRPGGPDDAPASSDAGEMGVWHAPSRLPGGFQQKKRGRTAEAQVLSRRLRAGFARADSSRASARTRESRANEKPLRRGLSEVFHTVRLPTDLRHCALILGLAAVAPLIAGGVKRVWPARPSPLHGIRAAGDLWRNRCAKAGGSKLRRGGCPNMGRRKLIRSRERMAEV